MFKTRTDREELFGFWNQNADRVLKRTDSLSPRKRIVIIWLTCFCWRVKSQRISSRQNQKHKTYQEKNNSAFCKTATIGQSSQPPTLSFDKYSILKVLILLNPMLAS